MSTYLGSKCQSSPAKAKTSPWAWGVMSTRAIAKPETATMAIVNLAAAKSRNSSTWARIT